MIPHTQKDCSNCGAPFPDVVVPGSTIKCRFCGHSYRVALPTPPPAPVPLAPQAGAAPAVAPAASEAPLPASGPDPLPELVVKGIWQSIQTGHELIYLDRDRLLDWQPASGTYHVWAYDRSAGDGDPLPRAIAQGRWGSIQSGHELIWLGGDHLLDREPASGAFRVWFYDQSAIGEQDVLPTMITSGQWQSIGSSKRLVYLGGDALLDWEPASGSYRIWRYERDSGGGDPLPGLLAEGQWQTIRTGHELVYLGRDAILDWVPGSGNFHLWRLDRSAQGSADPLPSEYASGNWGSIRTGHRLIYLGCERVLDWEPSGGAYRIWVAKNG